MSLDLGTRTRLVAMGSGHTAGLVAVRELMLGRPS